MRQIFYGNGTNTRVLVLCLLSSGKWYYEGTVLKDGPGTTGDVHNSLGWGLDDVGPREASQHKFATHSFYFMDSGWYKNFSGSNTNTSTGKWLEEDIIVL